MATCRTGPHDAKHASATAWPEADCAALIAALRKAGLRIDAARVADANEALRVLARARREDLYWGLHAVIVWRRQDSAAFHAAFQRLFVPPVDRATQRQTAIRIEKEDQTWPPTSISASA